MEKKQIHVRKKITDISIQFYASKALTPLISLPVKEKINKTLTKKKDANELQRDIARDENKSCGKNLRELEILMEYKEKKYKVKKK